MSTDKAFSPEEQLRLLESSHPDLVRSAKLPTKGQVEAYFSNWTPTVSNRNALPKPLRLYIHELQTECDPSGTIRQNVMLKATNRALLRELAKLKGLPEEMATKPVRRGVRGPGTRGRR